MVFCNVTTNKALASSECHNPYFNRWFSAIKCIIISNSLVEDGHNPYFNRWFSAIKKPMIY